MRASDSRRRVHCVTLTSITQPTRTQARTRRGTGRHRRGQRRCKHRTHAVIESDARHVRIIRSNRIDCTTNTHARRRAQRASQHRTHAVGDDKQDAVMQPAVVRREGLRRPLPAQAAAAGSQVRLPACLPSPFPPSPRLYVYPSVPPSVSPFLPRPSLNVRPSVSLLLAPSLAPSIPVGRVKGLSRALARRCSTSHSKGHAQSDGRQGLWQGALSDKCTGTQDDKCTDTQDTHRPCQTTALTHRTTSALAHRTTSALTHRTRTNAPTRAAAGAARALREAMSSDGQGLWPLAREARGTGGQTRPLKQRIEKAAGTENRELRTRSQQRAP